MATEIWDFWHLGDIALSTFSNNVVPFFSFKYLRGTICSIVLLFFGAFNLYFTLQGYAFLILACFLWCYQLAFCTSGVLSLNFPIQLWCSLQEYRTSGAKCKKSFQRISTKFSGSSKFRSYSQGIILLPITKSHQVSPVKRQRIIHKSPVWQVSANLPHMWRSGK